MPGFQSQCDVDNFAYLILLKKYLPWRNSPGFLECVHHKRVSYRVKQSSHLLIKKSLRPHLLHICSQKNPKKQKNPQKTTTPWQTWRVKKLKQIVMSVHGRSYRLLGPEKCRQKILHVYNFLPRLISSPLSRNILSKRRDYCYYTIQQENFKSVSMILAI